MDSYAAAAPSGAAAAVLQLLAVVAVVASLAFAAVAHVTTAAAATTPSPTLPPSLLPSLLQLSSLRLALPLPADTLASLAALAASAAALARTAAVRFLLTFSLGSWLFMTFFLVAGPLITWNRYRKQKPARSPRLTRSTAPPVSILRPLKGIDFNLEANLESSFLQDYPNFEIILPLPREQIVGVNPKVNNLIRGYNAAKSDIVWIMDSNISVDHSALARAVDIMQEPGVGLVHHVPCGVYTQSLGSLLDAVFLNTAHARMYSTINSLGVASCVVGKSNLFRRSALEDIGGLAYFGQFMAEDNIIGMAVMNKGFKHRVSPDLAYQSLGASTLTDTLYEPFSESLVACALAGWALNATLGVPFWPFVTLQFLGWFISDAFVSWVIHPGSVRGGGWTDFRMFALAWLLREVSALPVYLWAMSDSQVNWRGKRYYLHTDGTVEILRPGCSPKRTGLFPSMLGPTLRKGDESPMSPESPLVWIAVRGRASAAVTVAHQETQTPPASQTRRAANVHIHIHITSISAAAATLTSSKAIPVTKSSVSAFAYALSPADSPSPASTPRRALSPTRTHSTLSTPTATESPAGTPDATSSPPRRRSPRSHR
ncbi:glycosyl transferase family 21-domain-containing protein [Entophlyctis helioformis]|nr:glycosyl transferase family 21-domain-containing protein [Entophlyctis helioformis]